MNNMNPATQSFQKGSKEFDMFAEYYALLKKHPIPPIASEELSQAVVDAWWKDVHNQFIDFTEKYREDETMYKFTSGLAAAALERLDEMAKELIQISNEIANSTMDSTMEEDEIFR